METQAAEDRARQPIAPRPVAGKLAEDDEQCETAECGSVVRKVKRQRHRGNRDVDWNKNRDGEQKADQKLGGESIIFERIAGDLGIGPEKAAHVGHQPEAIDAGRDQKQRRAFDPQLPIGRLRTDKAH